MPRVTVVIPAYNATPTLVRTVNSVVAQTYDDLEIFVVDDGSTDATAELALQIAETDHRITVIRQRNAGVAAARNAALVRASGELTTWLDADDLWRPEKIERQVAVFDAASRQPSLVYTGYRLIDLEDRVIENFRTLADVSGYSTCRQIATNFFSNVSSIMAPTELAQQVGGHDTRLRDWRMEGAEDLLMQLQLSALGPVACCREALVGYRMHPNNMSLGYGRAARSNLKAIEQAARFLDDVPKWVVELGRARTVGYALHMVAAGDVGGARALVGDLMKENAGYTTLTLALIFGWLAKKAVGLGPRRDPELGKPFLDADPDTVPWHGHMILAPWHRRALDRCDAALSDKRRIWLEPHGDQCFG